MRVAQHFECVARPRLRLPVRPFIGDIKSFYQSQARVNPHTPTEKTHPLRPPLVIKRCSDFNGIK